MLFDPLLVDYNEVWLNKVLVYRNTQALNMPNYRSLRGEILSVYRSFIIFAP